MDGKTTVIDGIERAFAEVPPGFERAYEFWQQAVEANALAGRLAAKSKIYAGLATSIARIVK